MNLNEAYSILELVPTATPEEAKKKYRELTKKYHPDVNKDPGAEDKFKKINEAYRVVSTGKSTDREEYQPEEDLFSIFRGSPFNSGSRSTIHNATHISLNTSISFEESILGCKKEIKFHRQTKCVDCGGNGKTVLSNGCDKCGGRGKVVGRQGNMMFVSTCDKCRGQVQTQPCTKCSAIGTLDAEISISVSIPGGIHNGNVLRLSGIGNFVTSFGPMDQYTDVHLRVDVEKDKHMRLENNTVVSDLEISLLEAIKGCNKSINTVIGTKNVNIKPKSKHKDEILISKAGVNKFGDHKVILNIQYPDNLDKIIKVLSE